MSLTQLCRLPCRASIHRLPRVSIGLLITFSITFLSSGCTDDSGLPEPYASLTVPESLHSDQARIRGRELYLEHCVLCHGERADGNGQRRASLDPKPQDYTDPAWRSSATPRSVFFAIDQGIQGTPMPAWSVLSNEEIWDLVAYVLSVSEKGPYPSSAATSAETAGNATGMEATQ